MICVPLYKLSNKESILYKPLWALQFLDWTKINMKPNNISLLNIYKYLYITITKFKLTPSIIQDNNGYCYHVYFIFLYVLFSTPNIITYIYKIRNWIFPTPENKIINAILIILFNLWIQTIYLCQCPVGQDYRSRILINNERIITLITERITQGRIYM